METKTFEFNVKAAAETNTFEGYASVFGNVDRQGEIVQAGAFKNSIGRTVPVLYQHDEPIGKSLEMREDAHGLYVKAKISETPRGKEVMTLIKDGVLSKMSIGYAVKDAENSPAGKLLKDLDLMEFSVVSFPANEEAAITGAKKYDPKDFEPRSYRIKGAGLNEYLSTFDDYFKTNPLPENYSVIETLSCKATQDLFLETAAMFGLTAEEVS
jgi:uncharacterized protein